MKGNPSRESWAEPGRQGANTEAVKDDLSRYDWGFSAVPDAELVACCYWEYARESAFIRNLRKRCWDNWKAGGHGDDKLYADLDKLQSIGYASEVFLRGFFFDEAEDRKPRHPEAPPITGGFPQPWQTLSETERRCRAQIRTDRSTIPLVPFDRGYDFMAEWIVERSRRHGGEAERHRQAVLRANPGVSEMKLCEDGRFSFPEIDPRLFLAGGAEVGLFQIEWGSFTNEELRDGFYRWVKANRPGKVPRPDGRGHKIISWRIALEQLGILRLLHRFTVAELKARHPEAWRLYARPNRRWDRDAEKARERFRELFPFLESSEQPMSWPRKSNVKKRE